ncbi:uncharacterized protein Tco025E_02303 [Trypanosoma conorhini]|uniref:Uncharacterized protein n=1 Tax=Trypanosoma conorhini TaxID=83891 RepID=A0A3R7PGX4_9TRYP|nr:uncharacterized protein Tco025E_02303 [Trypanosoma conorhini]RNF25155.1 hypothetical protein Tco025E_02303 [Trypanosoma conorhini]
MANAFSAAFLAVVACLIASAGAQGSACTSGSACQPWGVERRCAVGKRMDLRYGVRLSHPSAMIAFGFCPVVDELQAFNLTGTGSLLSSLRAGEFAWMSIYGQGSAGNQTEDLSNAVLFAETSDACGNGERAVVNFIILRFSMTRGRYTYGSNTSYPTSSGFEPTCDSRGYCPYDSGSVCVGLPGKKNCAKCLAGDALKKAQTTVWVSYYGTDADGAVFTSGESNPAEFQRFSMGALGAMSRALDD